MPIANRLRRGYELAAKTLLADATAEGPWVGELSSSPLSTATAIAALELVRRRQPERAAEFEPLIRGGVRWLVEHQNADGGWGDTVLSHSNISTTTLASAALHLVTSSFNRVGIAPREDAIDAEPRGAMPTRLNEDAIAESAARAASYMERSGGFEAIRRRYGKDKTFSVPILTQCALAGLIPWRELTPLPFELGWLPHWFYRWIRLPVVSYALPALIAIGQVRHHHAPSWNPLVRLIRNLAVRPTLRRLENIQPESGGFLEATPLTSFVTMSLASMGQADHPVARLGVKFLLDSVRPDGSWPIDTNLATWVTTLSVNALRPESLSAAQAGAITAWLLGQQHRVVHRYTNAAPGGWAWTDLSGGVPDADDTPGAILALLKLNSPINQGEPGGVSPRTLHENEVRGLTPPGSPQAGLVRGNEIAEALDAAVDWLLDLQNGDGGWPTFCRGWGALPFDRSTPDLTAHALRAFRAWLASGESRPLDPQRVRRIERAAVSGFSFLERTQRPDGTWLPLWFGNQFASDEENPVYGTARALMAYRDCDRLTEPVAQRAVAWLASVQNEDGGWGGAAGAPSSIEETALATEALLALNDHADACHRGLDWLVSRVESGEFRQPSPIGLYFAKLWYFERLYPIIFATSALARGIESAEPS